MNILQKYTDFLPFAHKMPFAFSKHCTIGVGGIAPMALFPQSESELITILSLLQSKQIAFVVVGNLSNTLPSDGEIDRVVVCTKAMHFSRVMGEYLYAEAGISSSRILQHCLQAKLSGLEFLQGIPCTLGGAIYMNAGVNNAHIADVVESVRIYVDGTIKTLSLNDCQFNYKNSVFMRNHGIILGATFHLKKITEQAVQSQIAAYKEQRSHLPKGKSLGCIFKNPVTRSAGALIEGAGLKGMRIGDAHISCQHANFILNDGFATAKDIRTLITLIKKAVFAQYKIVLEEEIVYLE